MTGKESLSQLHPAERQWCLAVAKATMTDTGFYMPTGRRLSIIDPDLAGLQVDDVAAVLARTYRWGRFVDWTVAEHSMLCHHHATDASKPYALLHDVGEFVTGDVPSPVKDRPEYAALVLLEERWRRLLFQWVGLPEHMPPAIAAEVHELDMRARATERRDFMKRPPDDVHFDDDAFDPFPDPLRIRGLTRIRFLENTMLSSTEMLEYRHRLRSGSPGGGAFFFLRAFYEECKAGRLRAPGELIEPRAP